MAARLALILLAALLAVVSAAPITSRAAQWNAWKVEYNRAYASPAEEAKRQKIWNNNLDFIEKFDSEAKGFTVGMNQFGDLTLGEFASQMNNYFRNPNKVYRYANLSNVAVPSTMDWRTKGVVTAVKNQGQCGSCWSFSSTGSIEGAHAIATGNLVSLSEQNLIDCSSSYGNQGCNGGEMDDAFKYVIANGGIDTESSYPYTAAQGKCHYSASNSGATISNFQDVQHDETSLMNAVGSVGPVSVAIDASHQSFQFYTSGIYYEPQCSSTQLDHGVLTVGYGVQGSQDYWIVKNSWGPTWGLQGYIWMSRNRNNNCGIASDPSYPIVNGGASNSNSNSGNSNSNTNSNSASSAAASSSGHHHTHSGMLRNHM